MNIWKKFIDWVWWKSATVDEKFAILKMRFKKSENAKKQLPCSCDGINSSGKK
jgi:hypothetical protein